jgi:hypothetical protein
VERRLILLLLAAIAAVVWLAPRIDLRLREDACVARHGHWDARHRRCDPGPAHAAAPAGGTRRRGS